MLFTQDSLAYDQWRDAKLSRCQRVGIGLVEVANPFAITQTEHQALANQIQTRNFCLYEFATVQPSPRDAIAAFTAQLGLIDVVGNECADNDNITRVCNRPENNRYIPYSNRALNWHTDGYYNLESQIVRAFILHCEHAATTGGENAFMDPEMAYILLREENPKWTDALSHEEAMAIPANEHNAETIRERHCGPVFATDPSTQSLYTRYTARNRHVEWRDTSNTQQAREYFLNMLNEDTEWVVKHRLAPGQGIVCNNVLHKREAFVDDSVTQARLLYRARYRNRVHAA